jgi:hypothetical protein
VTAARGRRRAAPRRSLFSVSSYGASPASDAVPCGQLHGAVFGGVRYGGVEDFPDPLGDEDAFTVGDAAAVTHQFVYEYDFGDGWEHDVRIGQRLASVGSGTPRCLDGARACPPEDCGGPHGYERLLAALADPADPERRELLEWLGGEFDPDAFDVAATDDLPELYDRHTRQRTRR